MAKLSLKNVKISDISKTPIHQEFSTMQYPTTAKKIANAYASMIEEKINKYVKDKLAQIDDFTSQKTI